MHDLFDIAGKTVIVTGASAGIGAHLAGLFAQQGANVVLAARRREKLAALMDNLVVSLGAEESRLMAVEMDVTSRDSVEQGCQSVVDRFAAIDILINNAGIAKTARLIEMQEQDWQSVVETNLSSVWRVGQVVARQMMAQSAGGAIINIASILGFISQRQNGNYGAAKAAVIHLTKSMALEWGNKSIRVNAIAPGYFVTEINREFLTSDKGQQYLQGLFPRRAGRLEELEGPVLLLASDAGSYINGTVLTVDGGTLLSGA